MKRTLKTQRQPRASPLHTNLDPAPPKTQTINNETYTITQSILIVEGVLNGEYVPADEFAANVDAWNGVPVTLRHPQINGMYISAQTPEGQTFIIGYVDNASRDGNKLKADLFINENQCEAVGTDAINTLNAIKEGITIEVSTGYFALTKPESGVHNNKPYNGVQYDILPDHLAVLPDEIGACSIKDGCGTNRVNKKEEHPIKDIMSGLMNRIKQLSPDPTTNATHNETRRAIDAALANATGDYWSYYIVDFDDTTVTYQMYDSEAFTYDGLMKQRSYTLDETTMSVTLGDEQDVIQRTEYEPITNEETPTHQPQENVVEERKECPCMKEKVTALIQNARTAFTEEHREWLMTLNEEQLSTLEPIEPTEEAPQPKANTTEDVLAALGSIATEDAKAFIENAVQKEKQRRTNLIESLTSNTRCKLSTNDLNALSTDALEKLNDSLEEADYSNRPVPDLTDNASDNSDVLPNPSFEKKGK